jgi:hypothetical protein
MVIHSHKMGKSATKFSAAMDEDFASQYDPMSPDFEFQYEPALWDINCGPSAPGSPMSSEASPLNRAKASTGPGSGRARDASGRRRKNDQQNGRTKQIVEARLSQFGPSTSRARRILWELYGPTHNHDLLSLAKLCAQYLNIYLDREAQRLKPVLLKWFDENLEQIEPFLRNHIVVTCVDGMIGPPELIQQVRETTEQSGAAETPTEAE